MKKFILTIAKIIMFIILANVGFVIGVAMAEFIAIPFYEWLKSLL